MSIESVMPSNYLNLYNPLLLLSSIFPSIRGFSNESDLPIKWSKYWSFSFSISPSNEYSRLISFKIDWFDLLAVPSDSQETYIALQFESINSLVLSPLYGPVLTTIHDYQKNHSFESMASLVIQLVKNLPATQDTLVHSWVSNIRWRRDRLPTPVFLGFPGGSAGK